MTNSTATTPPTPDEAAVRALYDATVAGWNNHDAAAQAAPFADDGEVIGFDGSLMHGRAEIAKQLGAIFADHVTAPYTYKVKSVRFMGPEAAVLRAIVGMAPAGKPLMPERNAHQTLVAAKREGRWEIVLFQNTPAQFHGRPELVAAMTAELEAVRAEGW